MVLRKFEFRDYEDVVDMYYNFYIEVYGDHRKIGPKYFFYKKVIDAINDNNDIIVCVKPDGTITGFTLSHIDSFSGLTEPVYHGVMAYIKPEYRKGKSAYMLYKNVVQYAEELKMNLYSYNRIDNGTSAMIKKHFDPTEMFINFEKSKPRG